MPISNGNHPPFGTLIILAAKKTRSIIRKIEKTMIVLVQVFHISAKTIIDRREAITISIVMATPYAAAKMDRRYIGIDLVEDYCEYSKDRVNKLYKTDNPNQ